MADQQARVESVDAITMFRAQLIVYLEKMRSALDEILDDVNRTRLWLESDRRVYWQHQLRHRGMALEQLEQELFGARLSELRETITVKQMEVTRAKRAKEEAEGKLARVREWVRNFPSQVDPVAKEVDKLREVVDQDMERAVEMLTRTIDALQTYTEMRAPSGTVAPQAPPPTGETATGNPPKEAA